MFLSDFAIRHVDRSYDPILRNLLEHYCHDMAEWFLFDANEDGNYAYSTDKLWDADVHVYLAYAGRIPIGFALVGSAEIYTDEPRGKDLDEFFVVRRHRRSGLGRALATHAWDAYRGPWLVRVYQGNLPALPFWRRAIGAYTGGQFREEVQSVNDRIWSYITFDSAV